RGGSACEVGRNRFSGFLVPFESAEAVSRPSRPLLTSLKRAVNENVLVLLLMLLGMTSADLRAATITVTNTADTGPGTLRAALAAAADGDTIIFSVPLPATIKLTSSKLLVAKSVQILGPGPSSLAVDGNSSNRVFYIAPSNVVSIAGLKVTNGRV